MAKQKKVVISAAITGAIHTPTMSPYFPASPEQIAQQAIDAAKAVPRWCISTLEEATACQWATLTHFARF